MNHEYALTLKNLKCMVVRKISMIVGMLRNVPRHPILLITKKCRRRRCAKFKTREKKKNNEYFIPLPCRSITIY